MKTAVQEKTPESGGCLYALSPDYRPELKPGHVLCDQSLPVEERIQLAQAESIRNLNKLRPLGEAGDTRSQIEFAKEAKLLQWLCQPAAAEWVEEHYLQRHDILTKYRYQLLEDGFVRFTLSKGASYLEMFKEANRYCKERGPYGPAMDEDSLEWFAKWVGAIKEMEYPEPHEVQGLVPGSNRKTRDEQRQYLESLSLSWARLEEAAAAKVLYHCATGRDLFEGQIVRSATPRLELSSCIHGHGLIVNIYGFDDSWNVGAAGARNLKT